MPKMCNNFKQSAKTRHRFKSFIALMGLSAKTSKPLHPGFNLFKWRFHVFLRNSKEWRFSRQWVITFLPKYFDVKTHAFSQCWHVEASVVKRKICDDICRRRLHQQRVHFPIWNLKIFFLPNWQILKSFH